MGVVFVIAVLPALWQALTAYSSEGPDRLTESAEHGSIYVFLIQRSISVGIPVLYIMWRSRLGWSFFGLGRGPGIADVLLGAGLVVINYVLFYSFYYAKAFLVSEGPLYPLGALLTDLMPRWPSPLGLASLVLASALNGFAEEIVMRAYFIPRLEAAFHSTARAVVVSSIAFGGYHVYQGLAAAGYVTTFGLLLGLTFVWKRSFWPVFFAHFFADAMSFLSN